jgi:aerobic-type carbon monoxide dehydrogenase small subunit (CoxS/CutS family)
MQVALHQQARDGVAFEVNGRPVVAEAPPFTPLATVLRDEFGLTGTKIGCSAGDCGACTVLLDGEQVCACLVPLGQVAGRRVTTVEGLARDGCLTRLQEAFHRHGAAQCGICTPGMLMAATELLARNPRPAAAQVEEALGGVLCRCTGYRAIIDAVLAVADEMPAPAAEGAMGARLPRLDGRAKLTGSEIYGADRRPEGCLELRLVRSPFHRARFTLGDLGPVQARHPGLVRILTAADVPGRNSFGIFPHLKDQPVLAAGMVRHKGEPVLALVGEPTTIAAIRDE